MSTKFVECTLGVYYRDVDDDGVVYGGPMYYISRGLKSKGFATLGKIAADNETKLQRRKDKGTISGSGDTR